MWLFAILASGMMAIDKKKMTYWFKKLHLAICEDRRNRYQDFFSLFYVYCFHLEGQSGCQFPI